MHGIIAHLLGRVGLPKLFDVNYNIYYAVRYYIHVLNILIFLHWRMVNSLQPFTHRFEYVKHDLPIYVTITKPPKDL